MALKGAPGRSFATEMLVATGKTIVAVGYETTRPAQPFTALIVCD